MMGTGTERERGRERRRANERKIGTETGTGTGMETRGRTQDGNGDGSGDGNESRSGDGNEDGIVGGRGEAKKRKEPHKSCISDVGNGSDLGGKRKKRGRERIGSVASDLDNLENSTEAGGEAQGTQGSSKNCTSRESVPPLSRLIRGFRSKYH